LVRESEQPEAALTGRRNRPISTRAYQLASARHILGSSLNSLAALGRGAMGSWTIGVRTVRASRRCATFGASWATLDCVRAQATRRGFPPKTDTTVPIVIDRRGAP
jgi:hypothetical protein